MSLPAVLLIVTTLFHLISPLFNLTEKWRWLGWLAVPCLLGWQLWRDSFLPTMVTVYFLLTLMFLFALWRWRKLATNKFQPRKRFVLRIFAAILGLILLAIPLIEVAVNPSIRSNYRQHSWTAAFDKMHTTLETQYAFGDWKQIDWDELYATHYPRVVSAEQTGDGQAYYLALRDYVYSIPDGHLSLDGEDAGAKYAAIGGGFGFAVIELDNGQVIAHIVEEDGAAAQAGMTWGAEIVAWQDQPITTTVDNVSTMWAGNPPATAQAVSIHQHHLLTRVPIGSERTIAFRNRGATEPQTVVLTAYDDQYSSLNKAIAAHVHTTFDPPVEHRVLENGMGYIKITKLQLTLGGFRPVRAMNKAMQVMVDEDVPALVLDLRSKGGGLDFMVPQMMSYFTSDPLHYEHITFYDPQTQDFELWSTLLVEPNDLQFTKPVAILIDNHVISSKEGFGLIAQHLPQVAVIGIYDTHGSFGMSGSTIQLPGGLTVNYPLGQSLDKSSVVQLDSNQALEGGIQPDIRVPLTLDTAESIFVKGDDIVLNSATDWLNEQLAN